MAREMQANATRCFFLWTHERMKTRFMANLTF